MEALSGGLLASLLLVALVPGWLLLRLRARLGPTPTSEGLAELLEVAAVGLATTGLSAAITALVPHGWLPFLLDVEEWAAQGNRYLAAHPRMAIAAAVWVFALALLIGVGLHGIERLCKNWRLRRTGRLKAKIERIRRSGEFRVAGDVWTAALGERPPRKIPFLGVELVDGRTVHGPLHAITIDSRPDAPRAIALKRPIYLTSADGTCEELPFDRFVINELKIIAVTVVHHPVQQTAASA